MKEILRETMDTTTKRIMDMTTKRTMDMTTKRTMDMTTKRIMDMTTKEAMKKAMKETQTTTQKAAPTNFSHSHQNYGGEIYPSDFDTESHGNTHRREGSFIASRIACDSHFDEQCLRNEEVRRRIALYKAVHPSC